MDATVMREMTDAEVFGSPVRVPQTGAPRVPRGIRNNNPGNIEDGPFARSQPGYKGSDGRFAIYETPEAGTAAKTALLGSYGRKGINTVEGVVNRWAPPSENDSNSYAQFVSQKLGVDPRAPLDMNDPRVLSELSSAIAQRENGVAAPSSMPGVEMSESEVFGKPKPPPFPGQPGAVPIPQMGPGVTMERAPNPNAMPKADVLGEAWSGFTQPFRDIGANFTEGVADANRKLANPASTLPTSLGGFVKDQVRGIADSANIPLSALGLFGAPVQAVVRPISAAGARAGLKPSVGGDLTLKDGKLAVTPYRQTSGREAQAVIEGNLNTALSGARPAGPAAPPRLSVKDPEALVTALQTQKTAAYARVKALGGAYDGKSAAQLRSSITTDLIAEGLDAAAHPGAFSVVKRLDDVLTGKQPITLDELDKLRQVAWRNAAGLKGPDKGAERYFGSKIIDKIDDFIENAQPFQTLGGNPAELNAAIKEARAANQRYRNTQIVADKVDSAELRASTTYAGGNKANAVRENVRPLVDRTSAQRMRGLTKPQEKAVRQVATGTPAANTARLVGKLADPRGLLGMGFQAALQTVLGPASGGLSGIAIPLGAAASEASNAATMASVKKLLDLFANGPRPGLSAAPGIAGPYAPLALPSRVAGSGALIAPLPQVQRPTAKPKATVKR
jgi:hypothetical protein